MQDASAQQVSPETRSALTSFLKHAIRFVLHLSAVYIIAEYGAPWVSGWTRGTVLPFLQMPTRASSIEFLFNHIFALSFVPSFAAGLVNARLKHKVAWFVWIVPAVILAYEFVTFPAPSIFQSRFGPAWHQYFASGFSVAGYRDWNEFWASVGSNSDLGRGLAQLRIAAPFYAGAGYSLAASIGQRLALNEKISQKIAAWEASRFGRREQPDGE